LSWTLHAEGAVAGASHYAGDGGLPSAIAETLRKAGKDIGKLTTADLGTVDEFHIRGRQATLILAQSLNLSANPCVLDIGGGLGGPARTLVETYGCRVTGIDLTQVDAAARDAESLGRAGRRGRGQLRMTTRNRRHCNSSFEPRSVGWKSNMRPMKEMAMTRLLAATSILLAVIFLAGKVPALAVARP
jgi:SAM-dependent methyltransferase